MAVSAGGTDGCKQAEKRSCCHHPFAPHILPKSHPGSMLPKGNQQGTLLSCGTAFLTPAPSNIDFQNSYTRRSQTTVPTCCFPPNPSVPDSVPGTQGAWKGAWGGRRQHVQFQGFHVFLEAGRSQSLLSTPGGWGKATRQWAGPPASNCIALQRHP